MKRILLAALFGFALPADAAEPLVVELWPGKVAGDDAAAIGEEKWLDPRPGAKWQKWVTNVTRPTLTIYRPPAEQDTGASALICPGGGYHALMWDLEGEEVAAWLNSLGVTGMILKYRCPRRPGETKGLPAAGPLKDAQRAISLVRKNAAEWKLNPQRIGMIGFSAGGHLVGAAATNFSQRAYEPSDEVDQVSCRPDFGVMAYSGYFVLDDKQQLSSTVKLVTDAPPLFFVHAADDAVSAVENSLVFHLRLQQAGIKSETHIFATGGHGFGVRRDGGPCAGWTTNCADWLRSQGMLASGSASQVNAAKGD